MVDVAQIKAEFIHNKEAEADKLAALYARTANMPTDKVLNWACKCIKRQQHIWQYWSTLSGGPEDVHHAQMLRGIYILHNVNASNAKVLAAEAKLYAKELWAGGGWAPKVYYIANAIYWYAKAVATQSNKAACKATRFAVVPLMSDTKGWTQLLEAEEALQNKLLAECSFKLGCTKA